MVTAIEPNTDEAAAVDALASAAPRPHGHTHPPVSIPTAANRNRLPIGNAPGVNPMDFVRDNRIHVKDGSLFIDGYLALHPRELDPAHEAQLRKKLQLTFGVNNPSFFESAKRTSVAVGLGKLINPSLDAESAALLKEIEEHNKRVETGVDDRVRREFDDKNQPFTAVVREALEKPDPNPALMDFFKNGLAMYLLMREKLTQHGYLNSLTDYITRAQSPDQVLSELADKIGVTPMQVREAALKGGLDGVGQLLGLDARYVADVKAITAQAAGQEFSYNLIEHWHLGRQLLGLNAPMPQKITTGMDARITAKIDEYRARAHHRYDVPDAIQKEEARIAQALDLVEPVQRALMHKLGYELCYTPDMTADRIAHYNGVYGLHRKAANDMRDVAGTYRIYFSGRADLKESMRTLVHEIAHNLWPEQFSAEEIAQIDQLAASDAERFGRFKKLLDETFPEFERFVRAYQAGNDREKAAVIASAKEYFAPYGVSMDEGLFPYLRNAHDFRFMVEHAAQRLSVTGAFFDRSSYATTPQRFREVISRFAELKQVEHRSDPQLLHFLAPGLDQMFEAHYLPHLDRVYQSITTQEHAQQALHTTHHKNADFIEHAVEAKVREIPQPPASPHAQAVQEASRGTPVKAAACFAESAVPSTTVVGSAQYAGPANSNGIQVNSVA